mgnify:CR=1 FL=1
MDKFDLYAPQRSGVPSLPSYIATFQAAIQRLASARLHTSDDDWLLMLSNFLNEWFTFEEHITVNNQSLITILKQRGLL